MQLLENAALVLGTLFQFLKSNSFYKCLVNKTLSENPFHKQAKVCIKILNDPFFQTLCTHPTFSYIAKCVQNYTDLFLYILFCIIRLMFKSFNHVQ